MKNNILQLHNQSERTVEKIDCPFSMPCVQRSWITLAGESPVTVIASEPCS